MRMRAEAGKEVKVGDARGVEKLHNLFSYCSFSQREKKDAGRV